MSLRVVLELEPASEPVAQRFLGRKPCHVRVPNSAAEARFASYQALGSKLNLTVERGSVTLDRSIGALSPSGVLVPFEPQRLHAADVVGRPVGQCSHIVGTYGMGGPGFVGIELDGSTRDWLIIAIWNAASWIMLDGRLLGAEHPAQLEDEPAPWRPAWITTFGDPANGNIFRGDSFVSLEVSTREFVATLRSGRELRISDDPSDRPVLAGNGKPRLLEPDDDLREAVFLSPTTELWV